MKDEKAIPYSGKPAFRPRLIFLVLLGGLIHMAPTVCKAQDLGAMGIQWPFQRSYDTVNYKWNCMTNSNSIKNIPGGGWIMYSVEHLKKNAIRRDSTNLYIARFDTCQKPRWSKKLSLGHGVINSDIVRSDSQSFYLIVQFRNELFIDPQTLNRWYDDYLETLFIKINDQGKIAWTKAIEVVPRRKYKSTDFYYSTTNDGGLLFSGYYSHNKTFNRDRFRTLMKLRPDGTVAMAKSADSAIFRGGMYKRDMTRITKNDFAFLGDGNRIFFVTEKGKITGAKEFRIGHKCINYQGNTHYFRLRGITAGKDSGLYVAGYVGGFNPDPCNKGSGHLIVFKLNGKRKVAWRTVFDPPTGLYGWKQSCNGYWPENDFYLRQARDESLFVFVQPNDVIYNNEGPFYVRFDPRNGKFLENYKYPSTFRISRWGESSPVVETRDTNFLMTGINLKKRQRASVLKIEPGSNGQCLKQKFNIFKPRTYYPLRTRSINVKARFDSLSYPFVVRDTSFKWQEVKPKTEYYCNCNPYHYTCPALGPDTVICYDSTHILKPGPDTSILNYSWNTGDTGASLQIDTSGLYKVTISRDGCKTKDSIHVTFLQQYPARFPLDTTLCRRDSVYLSAPDSNVQYRWLPAGVDSFKNGKVVDSLDRWVKKPGRYALYLDTFPRCPLKAFRLKRYQRPATAYQGDTVCKRDTVLLRADTLQHAGWFPSCTPKAATPELEATDTGRYLLKDTFYGCMIDTFRLSHVAYERVLAAGDTLCPYDSTLLVADTTQDLAYGWSLPGEDSVTHPGPGIWVKDTGSYTLWETEKGCRLDTYRLNHHRLPEAQAGPDTLLCHNQVYTMQGSGGVRYKWIPAKYLSNDTIAHPKAQLPDKQAYILIVSNEAGCRDTAGVVLDVRPPLEVTVSAEDSAVCKGSEVKLKANGGGGYSPGYRFEWSGVRRDDSVVHKRLFKSGSQVVTLKDGCSEPAVDSIALRSKELPVASFSSVPEDTVLVDDTARFIDQSRKAERKQWWIDGDLTGENADTLKKSFEEPGRNYPVSLGVEASNGCRDTMEGRIYVAQAFRIFIPNAFSPDGDGLNEAWRIRGIGIESYRMTIYNRWGEEIHSTGMQEEPAWDGTYRGKAVPAGRYLYKVEVKDKGGFTHYYQGEIRVIR